MYQKVPLCARGTVDGMLIVSLGKGCSGEEKKRPSESAEKLEESKKVVAKSKIQRSGSNALVSTTARIVEKLRKKLDVLRRMYETLEPEVGRQAEYALARERDG